MKADVGLWIDHRQAVIVVISTSGEEIRRIVSNLEKHVRFSGADAEDGAGEDIRDRKFGNHLNNYFDEIIASIRDANSIQIFGPGEAKSELNKRLEETGLKGKVISVETVDKMTDRQIIAKVHDGMDVRQD